MTRSTFVLAVLATGMTLACSEPNPTGVPESGLAAELTRLAEALRERGFSVEIQGPATLPFLTGMGAVWRVDAEGFDPEGMTGYGYPDATSAAREASWFGADASSIVTETGAASILWIATPHLFLNETLLVLYVGDNARLLMALNELLGTQIAGR